MAQRATLIIEDNEYLLINFTMEISRDYDHRGRPATMPRVGMFHMELESVGDHFFAAWSMFSATTKNGQIKLYRRDEDATLKTYDFEDAYIMSFRECYNAVSSTSMSIVITIYANVVELNPGGICIDNGWHS